jgi:hypothetical protein
MTLPPIPQLDLTTFQHPLAKPYRFFAFDFEVYEEDTLLCIFDCTEGKWEEVWGTAKIGRYLDALFLDERAVICGYNSRGYDNVIAALCIAGKDQKTVKMANDVLVGKLPLATACEWVDWGDRGGDMKTKQDAAFRTPGYFDIYARSYDAGFDLGQKMIGAEKVPCMSLKTWQRLNGVPVLRTPVPFDKIGLTEEDRALIAHYCRYDVATVVCIMTGKEGSGNLLGRAGLVAEKPDKMKWGMTKPKMSEIYLDADKTLCPKEDEPWANGGVVQIPDCIRIEKYTGVLDFFRQPADVLEKTSYSCEIMGRLHNFGIGGLHSEADKAERFIGQIWDIDAGALYPSIMIEYGLTPRSVPDPEAFKKLKARRMNLKKKKDPMADALKIVLNSTFGATKNKYSALYDPYVGLSVCVVGQLLLVDLLERMEPYVETLIQSNTDGLYLILKDKAGADKAVAEFEKRTGMSMEWGEFRFMYQANVNNYVAQAADGSIKMKGGMFRSAHASVQSPAQKVCTARALGEQIDLSQFTLNEFAISCTRDKNSRGFLVNGVEIEDEYLEVVAVSCFDSVPINTLKQDGIRCKARLCPECALPLRDADISMIDVDYYLAAAASIEEVKEVED